MSRNRNTNEDYDPENWGGRGTRRQGGGAIERFAGKKRTRHMAAEENVEYADLGALGATSSFAPTFNSSRHEREWIMTYLGAFYDEQKILDVLRKVKGGKEANVYCCRAHPDMGVDLIAAKIYRPRLFRNLRNDALYRQGRRILDEFGKEVHDSRALHAIYKKTRVGKEFSHISWLQHEYTSMQVLFDAGVDVPEPLASGANTILMEYIGDLDVPAPTLNEVDLPRAEARELFERLMWDVERMLAQRRIHGDLSAYNVLYWDGKVTLIDFPQAVDPEGNPRAYPIFQRDVRRLCQYFERYGIRSAPEALAQRMWLQAGFNPSHSERDEAIADTIEDDENEADRHNQ